MSLRKKDIDKYRRFCGKCDDLNIEILDTDSYSIILLIPTNRRISFPNLKQATIFLSGYAIGFETCKELSVLEEELPPCVKE